MHRKDTEILRIPKLRDESMNLLYIRIVDEHRLFISIMCKYFMLRISFFIFLVALSSCGTVQIYEDPNNPVYLSNDINSVSPVNDSLVVMIFNIEKSEKIELAISELKAFESTLPVDIYLLQEMDEKGVKVIARELKLNYLYMPNVHYKMRDQDIGNAILARGSIRNPMKLVLPHKKWVNGRKRNVTIGEVIIRNKSVLVYSVHTETSTMGRKKRMDQWDAIIEHARVRSGQYKYTVIGGDFNTLFSKDAKLVVQKFDTAGFQCATAGTGYTARALYGLVKPTEDHIFGSGFQVLSSGKIDSSKASDHLPVYAVFRGAVGR